MSGKNNLLLCLSDVVTHSEKAVTIMLPSVPYIDMIICIKICQLTSFYISR